MHDATTSPRDGQPGTPGPADLVALAEPINREHRACETAFRDGLQHAMEAGRLLNEAKSRCDHGQWYGFIVEHFEGSPRLAQKYMRLARLLPQHLEDLGPNAPRVADLSFRQALSMLTRNAQVVAKLDEDTQEDAIEEWESNGHKNAQQAVAHLVDVDVPAKCHRPKAPPDDDTADYRDRQDVDDDQLDDRVDDDHLDAAPATPPKRSGKPPVGVILANEALNALMKIPKNDALRDRAFEIVVDYCARNWGADAVAKWLKEWATKEQ